MKVLLINGSPHEKGCTFTALTEVAGALENQGIETEIFHVGVKPVIGCTGCGVCRKKKSGRCTFDDTVNIALAKAESVDGLVFGSPVHYASASGAITSFLDRFFYAGGSNFAYKPGAALVSLRRGGSTAALEQLNKYFTISNMPVVSSIYWNMIHGNTPDEIRQDLEGMQTMRMLGKNMAWLLKCIEAGKKAELPLPEQEVRIRTNFIR